MSQPAQPEAVPRRSDYRTFSIKHEGGQDDFKSIGFDATGGKVLWSQP